LIYDKNVNDQILGCNISDPNDLRYKTYKYYQLIYEEYLNMNQNKRFVEKLETTHLKYS